MGDSSTSAAMRGSSAAAAWRSPRPSSGPRRGWKATVGLGPRRVGDGVEPGRDVARLAAAERGIRSPASAVSPGIEAATFHPWRFRIDARRPPTPRGPRRSRGAGGRPAPGRAPAPDTSGPPAARRRRPGPRSVRRAGRGVAASQVRSRHRAASLRRGAARPASRRRTRRSSATAHRIAPIANPARPIAMRRAHRPGPRT